MSKAEKNTRFTGVLLICCALVSLLISNTAYSGAYLHFWQAHFPIPGPTWLPVNPLGWVNEGLMSFFFLLTGLEIRKELLTGELSTPKKAWLPAIAALGGMIFPILIFFAFNTHSPDISGWGIPMTTDIAFSLGILSLAGKRVPNQLRILLTALAITDDLVAILVIAFFYSRKINGDYLAGAALCFLFLIGLYRLRVRHLGLFVIPALILWFCLYNSGIPTAITGILVSLCLPLQMAPLLEKQLEPWVNWLILPVFALANTAIHLPVVPGAIFSSGISLGIICGLFIGKPLGIFLFCLAGVKLKFIHLPQQVTWKQLLATGMIAGTGFTMSLYISALAYPETGVLSLSKIAVILGSALSGTIGLLFLINALPKEKKAPSSNN